MCSSGPRHVVWTSRGCVSYLSPRPWTPGSVVVESSLGGPQGGSVFDLREEAYLDLLLGARAVSHLLCERLGVHRCALVSRPQPQRHPLVQVLPLHGLGAEWRPHLAADEEFNDTDPGYCTSKSAPRWREEQLTEIQGRIRAMLPDPRPPTDFTFLGEDPGHPCIFSRIVRGEELQWRVWDDPGHVAFLTPFPNTPGLTVVVPRRPLSSDIFSLEEQDYVSLVRAARTVALLLQGLGASAVGMIFEGFEIDYAHVKLMPLFSSCPSMEGQGGVTEEQGVATEEQGVATEEQGGATEQQGGATLEQDGVRAAPFYITYPGFVSSEDGPEASAHSLTELHARLTS